MISQAEKALDVAVIGNVGIDTNVYFPYGSPNFEREGNFTDNRDYIGQAGGYGSRGFAQLGKKTAFIGYVGDDYSGRYIRDEFSKDGIDTSALFIDPAGTSRSINFMYDDGRRKNFYDGKSHMTISPDMERCKSILQKVRLAHFNIPNWARSLLPIARENGVVISCDIQDVLKPEDAYRQDFITYADILFFSAVNHDEPTPLIQFFMRDNPNRIVISGMGSRGCALGTQGQIRYFGPVDYDQPVIDTNGAGDGLAVGFLSSYILDGFSLEESILRGQITARHTCSIKAESNHLIRREQLESEFTRHQHNKS